MLPLLLLFGGHSCYHYSQQVPFLTNYKTISQKEPYVLVLRSRPKNKRWTRDGVKSNRTNFELIFIEFFQLFFIFWINRFINFRIESNRTNFERIQHLKIWLHPIIGVKSNRTNFELIFIEFFVYFLPFSNQSNRKFSNRIERISKEFQFDSTPTVNLHSM